MKKYMILFLGFFWFSFSSAFAIDAPLDISISKVTDTSMELDWSDVSNAIGYYVYYGTKTGSGSNYEVEGIDLIDDSEFLLEGLKAETKYYIAFTAVDASGEESAFSKEFEYSTLTTGQSQDVGDFKITGVEVIDSTSLEFSFSAPLDIKSSALREFKIENKITNIETLVDISEVNSADNSKVLVVLGAPLLENTQYKVTVLSISSQKGDSIELGIDAFINFTTPKTFTVESSTPTIQENPVSLPEIDEKEVDLQSAPIESGSMNLNQGNAGSTISQNELSSNTLEAANSTEKLPQTGPGHWLLIILATLFSGIIYVLNNRKNTVR